MPDETSTLAVAAPHEMFEAFDLADEEQIIAEISGRVTDKYVYTLKGVRDPDGNPVQGLSYAGTNWAVREYAKQGEVLRVHKDMQFLLDPTDPDYVVCVASAQRFAVNRETGREIPLDTRLGVSRQWKFMKKRKYDGEGNVVGEEIVEDSFFLSKVSSKASRNSLQALMPTDVVKKLIAAALAAKNGKDMGLRGQAPQREKSKKAAPQESKPPSPVQESAAPTAQSAPTAAAPAAPPKGKEKMSKDVLIQHFDAVLKGAFSTQDALVARQGLERLTGKSNPADFDEDNLKKLGAIFRGVAKKESRIEGNKVFSADGKVLLEGPAPAVAKAAPSPAPAQQEEDPF